MRTTLEIDDDVLDAARELARLKNEGLGRAISELARKGLVRRKPTVSLEHGIPVIQREPGDIPVTSEMVRNLLEEEQ